ncbi:hypothetical protein [Winogradskyella sp. SM1960]|uniref:hypothetical protein n=1 Tax=Winogradskyella sp. SM1960 TaxID=2865955 RepID=UPI001CD677C3|nr:hypothetical protein [Winogradskyella sp. SM1960]
MVVIQENSFSNNHLVKKLFFLLYTQIIDLQTRKLNLITYLAQIKDEILFDKLENYILKRVIEHNPDLKPFTVEELVNRIEKSELDFKNRNVKNQEDLERISANW